MSNLKLTDDGFITPKNLPFRRDQIVYIKGRGKQQFKVISAGLHCCILDPVMGGSRRMVSNKVIRKTSRST